ncbi:MAG TPA: hypothetical protein VGP94_12185 [Tepidisphaeraceae bacterium]|jgi:hypothetical protein|nr:hypothetical protein [Tepidisphaeraceae bacterium]
MKTLLTFWAAAICFLLIPRSSEDPNIRHCGTLADDKAIASISDTWKERYNAGDAAKVAALYP